MNRAGFNHCLNLKLATQLLLSIWGCVDVAPRKENIQWWIQYCKDWHGYIENGPFDSVHVKKFLSTCWRAQMVKNVPAKWETWVQSLGGEDPLEKGMAIHSSILAWRIPWTEEPGGPQSRGLQRVGHESAANTLERLICYIFILCLLLNMILSSNHIIKSRICYMCINFNFGHLLIS